MAEIKGRPTVYSGIQMRSRLEATVAANLDRANISWTYEPGAFAAPGMRQWLPDFRLELAQQVAYLEVKGSLRGVEGGASRADHRRELMTRMAVAWESEPDVVLVIAEDEWAIVESNPYRRSVWAGSRTSGWHLAVLLTCARCRWAQLAPWLGTAEATWDWINNWSFTCEKPAVTPFYLFKRAA